jgi:hypothetical protein
VNRLGQARQTLVDAIAPVLSGRTAPYPPTPQQAGLAPAVWVDQSDGFRTTIGERTSVIIATFPINVVYDGTDRAQVAGIDEIVSGIVDAVAHVRGAEVARWRRQPTDPNQPNRRSCVLEVDYTITATTLCLPDVGGDVVDASSDVVDGAADVIWAEPVRADIPPEPAPIPAAGGDQNIPPTPVEV